MCKKLESALEPDDAERLDAVFRLVCDLAATPAGPLGLGEIIDARVVTEECLIAFQAKLAVLLATAARNPQHAAVLVSRFPSVFSAWRATS